MASGPRQCGQFDAASDGSGLAVVIDDLHYDTTYVLYQALAESNGLEVRVVESEGGRAPVFVLLWSPAGGADEGWVI